MVKPTSWRPKVLIAIFTVRLWSATLWCPSSRKNSKAYCPSMICWILWLFLHKFYSCTLLNPQKIWLLKSCEKSRNRDFFSAHFTNRLVLYFAVYCGTGEEKHPSDEVTTQNTKPYSSLWPSVVHPDGSTVVEDVDFLGCWFLSTNFGCKPTVPFTRSVRLLSMSSKKSSTRWTFFSCSQVDSPLQWPNGLTFTKFSPLPWWIWPFYGNKEDLIKYGWFLQIVSY